MLPRIRRGTRASSPIFVELPDERDACGAFCVFGYPHVSACVIGQILSKARPDKSRGASLVECTTRASLVMIM